MPKQSLCILKEVIFKRNLTIIEGGVRGGPKNRKTAQKYAKKPQNASDFFPNTETARTCRPQYES